MEWNIKNISASSDDDDDDDDDSDKNIRFRPKEASLLDD
jgi:hypothetical protein